MKTHQQRAGDVCRLSFVYLMSENTNSHPLPHFHGSLQTLAKPSPSLLTYKQFVSEQVFSPFTF
jgi:hypothetical protein